MKIYDISQPLDPDTAVFPGDNGLKLEPVMRMDAGAACDVTTMRMSVHCGTHADAPSHFVAGAPASEALDLSIYIGPCRVLHVEGVGAPRLVDPNALTDRLDGVTRVLLRTCPDLDYRVFDPQFTALGPAAAAALVEAGIRLIGIDAQSMDHGTCKDLGAHHTLRAGGVALLENLDLSAVPEGDYELVALPLKLVGADAAPVRAILRELPAARDPAAP